MMWAVGYNTPGYLPEHDPEEYDSFDEYLGANIFLYGVDEEECAIADE